MTTHYIPSFTRRNGRQEQAACGAWCRPSDQSAEPSCVRCAAWLLEEAKDETKGVEDVFGAPDPEAPGLTPLSNRDITGGRERRAR